MEEKYSNEECVAIASVLCDLVYADYRQKQGESECLKSCLDELGFETEGFVLRDLETDVGAEKTGLFSNDDANLALRQPFRSPRKEIR